MILDIVMPKMSGQEVASAVRELSDDVGILLVSGYIPEQTDWASTEHVLRKPYTISELMAALRSLA